MEQMILAGMNVARLNFSHGDFAGHKSVIQTLRAAERATGRRVSIMADLPGPKMRIGQLKKEPMFLQAGAVLTITTVEIAGDETRVSTSFDRLAQAVKPGDLLYLCDGLIQLQVSSIERDDVHCLVLVGGELRSRKGLNLPDIELGISAFTQHDRACLRFALDNGVEAVSQSFVEKGEDIQAVRAAARSYGHDPFIIAKIERSRALNSIEQIIDAADGIMIARGDLGVELPIEQIPVVQKDVTRLANMRGRPVITATQMLESMTSSPRPTRAEATDVANAILDGTDCVMLSGESAVGNYPVEAVSMLARIAVATEPHKPAIQPKDLFEGIDLKNKVPAARLTDLSIATALEYSERSVVFVGTYSGTTARSIARVRPQAWIVAVSSREDTCRHLQFSFGVHAVHEPEAPRGWSTYARDWLKAHGVEADVLVLAEGPAVSHCDASYSMEVIDLKAARVDTHIAAATGTDSVQGSTWQK
jgi:pyruvate kinase